MIAHDGGTDERQFDIIALLHLVHGQSCNGIGFDQMQIGKDDQKHKTQKKRAETKDAADIE
jgi:hypothetical protein